MPRSQRTYDHRLVRLAQDTADIAIATGVGAPLSTASGWLRRTRRDVTTVPTFETPAADLRTRLARMEARLRRCQALLLAQRLGRVFAPASTRHRLIRERGWRRPRLRLHPHAPREGIRAEASNGLWHIDTTVVRLQGGTKAFVQAVIDNFSRRILAWRVTDRLEAGTSVELLVEAAAHLPDDAAGTVLADQGVENSSRSVGML